MSLKKTLTQSTAVTTIASILLFTPAFAQVAPPDTNANQERNSTNSNDLNPTYRPQQPQNTESQNTESNVSNSDPNTRNQAGSDTVTNVQPDTQYSAIDDLPQEGTVSISGTVESVDIQDNSFILRDGAGETIDVHTTNAINFQQGDSVMVSGLMTDEILNIGEQIVSARVQVLN